MEQFESICLIRIHSANTLEREWIIFVEFLAVDIQTPTNREAHEKKWTKKPLREPPLRGNQPMPLIGAARYERRSKIFALLF